MDVRPGLTVTYVDADTLTGDSPEPTRDRYLQIGPTVELAAPVADGLVRASYEPRFRLFSSIPEVGTTTHMVNAGLDLPLGTRVDLRGNYHFSHGVLETREVDPGQEYFFDLGRFTRNDVSGTLDVELGPRMNATVGAATNDVDFSGSRPVLPLPGRASSTPASPTSSARTRRARSPTSTIASPLPTSARSSSPPGTTSSWASTAR